MKTALLFLFLILSAFCVSAQQLFTITGQLSNGKGQRIEAATVFIDGSGKATVTNDKGEFSFAGIEPGTYQIVTSMLGYTSVKQTVVVKNESVIIEIPLQEKQISLDVVVIGNDSQRKNFLKLFTKYFMGESDNAKACKILNPEIIDFSTEKALVKAATDKFLIIENASLGYRIKYLLRNFQYNKELETTIYDGECIFEDLKGTPEQISKWNVNRQKAYEGSLMHYLRSVYLGKSREEGFLTYAITSLNFPLVIDPNPIVMEQIIQHTDSNFYTFKYKKRLYTLYDKKKASAKDKYSDQREVLEYLHKMGSVLQLNADVDRRGSYANYKDILIQGFWGSKRIGDQLPLEYSPI